MKKIYIAVLRAVNTTQILESFVNREDAEKYRELYLNNMDNRNWYSKFRLKVMNSRSETIAILPCDLHENGCVIINPPKDK